MMNLQQKTNQPSFYQWKEDRKKLRSSKPKAKISEIDREIKDEVWNYLLNNDSDQYNAYQRFSYFRYTPKPNPKDAEANEAAILLREAQGKFLQMKDIAVKDDAKLYHLDLNSAYLTALANIKHSLKYKTNYKLLEVSDLHLDEYMRVVHDYIIPDYFNLIKVQCEMPYNQHLNMFTTNKKIKYRGKEVSDTNIPPYGAIVDVRVELLVNNTYRIDAWEQWWELFKDYEINYKSTTVWVYELVNRPQMFDLEALKGLLDAVKDISKDLKKPWKQAMVSFTGMLAHIDPGRRLLMLASAEEVIRRLFLELRQETRVYGIQIDAIYFAPYDWDEHPVTKAHRIGMDVYGLKNYEEDRFSKLELWDGRKYKQTTFRLQEV